MRMTNQYSEPADWDSQQIKSGASFLQSSYWADFQRQLGHQTFFLRGPAWSCLLIERKTPLGKYLFAPYGPTLESAANLQACLRDLKSFAEERSADWLSLEPLTPDDSHKLRQTLASMGGKKARNREPDLTRLIDLSPQPEEILASISQSTRSFIRKNQREKLLTFKTSTDPSDIQLFIRMLDQVSGRNKVFFFSSDYFQKQAKCLMPAGVLFLEIALMDGQPVASALFHDYGTTSSYTYAASMPAARKTSASALLLWQAMLNAKERGQQRLDLFGIAPDNASASHPWHGFSSFKKKFGGQVIEHAGTWDFPQSRKYQLYRAAQAAKRLGR